MSDYSQITFFEPKDYLAPADPLKLIRGAEIDPEFAAISVAIGTKFDVADIANQAQAEAGSSNTVLMTPLRVQQFFDASGVDEIANPFTVGDGTGDSSIIIDAGSTVSNDFADLFFKHDGSTGFKISSVPTATGYRTYLLNDTEFFPFIQFDSGDANEMLVRAESTFVNSIVVDNELTLNDETDNPGDADWRLTATGSSGNNLLVLAPPGSWSGSSNFTIRTQSGSTLHSFQFVENGILRIPRSILVSNDHPSGADVSYIEIENYNNAVANNGSYFLKATGNWNAAVDSALLLTPAAGLTGEVVIQVGSGGYPTWTWVFNKSGELTRNNVVMLT